MPARDSDMKQEIREFIAQSFFLDLDQSPIESSVSLVDNGIIDSTGILELVHFIEERYQIQVEDRDIVRENLDSLDSIETYVRRKRNASDRGLDAAG